MKTVIRKMSNSQGVIIAKRLLNQIGVAVNDQVDMRVEHGRIVIASLTGAPRRGWAEDSKRLAKAGEVGLVWPEFPNKGDQNFEWGSVYIICKLIKLSCPALCRASTS